jgi:hypothetical protein
MLRGAAGFVDAADIPPARADGVVLAVFVDPGAETGGAELKSSKSRSSSPSRSSGSPCSIDRAGTSASWGSLIGDCSAFAASEEEDLAMHSKFATIVTVGVLVAAGTAAWAQNSTVNKTPGHMMQNTPQSKSTGPGASEYAPGHLKRKTRSESASQLTPSRRSTPTTTGSGRR